MAPGVGPRPRAEPFYNPAMALDRDVGVALVRALERAPGDGWEATAATGVRGLRLLRETSGFRSFVLTEANPRTFAVLRTNAARDPRASALCADGVRPPPSAPFGYVDVDPYGSPLPFLAGAVRATRTGGVLAVTATDMPVLAGAQPAACRRRYGASPVRGRLGPEGALRILLMVLVREARAQGRGLRPLLAYVGGHHVRAYVELLAAPLSDEPVGPISAEGWTGPDLGHGDPWGPFWLGPLVEPGVAGRLEVPPSAERPRQLARFLAFVREDALPLPPFYFEGNVLASALGLGSPPPLDEVLVALRARGYRAGRTHVRPEGLRTDAPRAEVEATVRQLAGAGQSQNARVRA